MTVPSLHFDEDMVPSSTERDWHGRGVAYTCAPTTPLGERDDLDRVNSASVRRVITEAVRETVEIEGPILLDRLARDVARRFGFDRVSAARKEFVVDCVPTELMSTTPLGTFVWPRQINKADWRGFRKTPDDVTRPVSDIAPEEILNAMSFACEGRELGREALIRETLAIFNQRRLTGPTRERLEECLNLGFRRGRLIPVGSVIRSGS